jgi:hypothetical protein
VVGAVGAIWGAFTRPSPAAKLAQATMCGAGGATKTGCLDRKIEDLLSYFLDTLIDN